MIYKHSPQHASTKVEQEAKRKSMARVIAKLERIHNETRDILNALGADTSGMAQADALIKEVKEYIGPEYPTAGVFFGGDNIPEQTITIYTKGYDERIKGLKQK